METQPSQLTNPMSFFIFFSKLERQKNKQKCPTQHRSTLNSTSILETLSHLEKWHLMCSFSAGMVGSSLRHTWQRRGRFNNSLVPSLMATFPLVSTIWMMSENSARGKRWIGEDKFAAKRKQCHTVELKTSLTTQLSHLETQWNNLLWRSSSVFCSSNMESRSLDWSHASAHDCKRQRNKSMSHTYPQHIWWGWRSNIKNIFFFIKACCNFSSHVYSTQMYKFYSKTPLQHTIGQC